MKDLLQQVGVSKTQSRWNTVTQKRSHIQRHLASLKRHWSKRTGQSPYEGRKEGMFRNFFCKSQNPGCCD